MKQFFAIFLAVSLASCSEENPQLILKYELKWELDLEDSYPPGQFPVNSLSSFKLLNTGTDLIVVSGFYVGTTTDEIVTKVNNEGVILKDLTLPGMGYAAVTLNESRQFVMLYQDAQYQSHLDRYDTDFNLLSSRMLDFGTEYQATMALGKSAIYKHRHKNSGEVLTSYNFDGEVQWDVPFFDLGCGGNSIRVLFNDQDLSLVAESYPDSIKLSQINSATGKLYWNKLLMKQTVLPETGYMLSTWTSLGKLALLGMTYSGEELLVAYYNRSVTTKSVNMNFDSGTSLSHVLATKDGGLLIGLRPDVTVDPVNYKLLKLDSEGNAGWVGSFTQVGSDNLIDLIELNDGTVITLSQKGHIQALSPIYN